MNSTDPAIKMPGLARNLIDTTAVQVMGEWINSLPGTPALAPPAINPPGGTFNLPVTVTLQSSDTNAAIYYTLDGSLPTLSSALYSSPFVLTSNATVFANAAEASFATSVAVGFQFNISSGVGPGAVLNPNGVLTNGTFNLQVSGTTGRTYVLQGSTNLRNWIPVNTNIPASSPFTMTDPGAANFLYRYYRAVQLP
jgi:hypothetical protein